MRGALVTLILIKQGHIEAFSLLSLARLPIFSKKVDVPICQ